MTLDEWKASRVCFDCGGWLLAGEELHATSVKLNATAWVEYRCRACAEMYAWACWNEDWGPYPATISRVGGRA